MKTLTRLFVSSPLAEGTTPALSEKQSLKLIATLRAKVGQQVALFNGVDGEWFARIDEIRKKAVVVTVTEQHRVHVPAPDICLCFAPVKNEKIDHIAKRSTELGVSVLQPVMTQYTIV